MNFSVKWEKNGVHVMFSGIISIEDIVQSQAVYQGDSRYEELKYSICDFRNCDSTDVNPAEVNEPLSYDLGASSTLEDHKLALIATNEYSRMLIENYIATSRDVALSWEVRLFNSESEARNWVNT